MQTVVEDKNQLVMPTELLEQFRELQQLYGKWEVYQSLAEEAKNSMANFYADDKEREAKLRRDDLRRFEQLLRITKEKVNEQRRLIIHDFVKKFPMDTPTKLHTWLANKEEFMKILS